MSEEVALAAEACVGWHDSWMRAFGLRTERDPDVWRLLDQPPQPWYFTAITCRPEAPPVDEFEAVSVRGFGNEDASVAVGAAHPATIGVFGVTTVASARRRGYGTAMTRAATWPTRASRPSSRPARRERG
jgi:hypothetical protein